MTNTILTEELKSHFLRLYQIALSDDNFGVLELQMLYHFADERGVPKSEMEKLLLNPTQHESIIPNDITERINYLYDLTRMILVDDIVTEDEKNALKKYCKKFDFLEENIDDITTYLIDCVQKGIQKDEIINQLNS
ncbi:hypothetical protein [Flavobacterium sp. '19STA2R22 D10 B1']|uniref:hypothetical protein n=1 Tax=Flavobacterium aerium TaxID=3037261 RepID=UPI00278BD1C7|nr:hypothetical protein [Flavobacterium sp. '19STA2R22 D10 B1']